MHEMSLMESVREIVEDTAHRHGAARVMAVRLAIGALATVEPEALRFAFDVVMRAGLADGARLEIEEVPGTAWCWDCSSAVPLAGATLDCPECGGHRLEVTGGTEMRVSEIDLAMCEETATCA
jgi:hydrogenase nickel incorporation protein HypA/HybF